MNDQLVIVEKQNRIVTLTLNNPDQRNALSFDLVEELYRAVQEIKADSEVLAVILTGTGKGFSSGGDVSSMAPREGMSEEEAASFIKSYYMKNLSVMPWHVTCGSFRKKPSSVCPLSRSDYTRAWALPISCHDW
ncbi:MAG: enoyl-CoA hydratase/isomerase family protein [Deltaproteobacteria bacterium]|nr:enoyl-CoA hydratase/isomerase family protein [Deltaproteobacteria bacterium]